MSNANRQPQVNLYLISDPTDKEGGPRLLRLHPGYDDILDEKSGIWGEEAKRIIGNADMTGSSRTEIWRSSGERGGEENVGRTWYEFTTYAGREQEKMGPDIKIDTTALVRLSGQEKWAGIAELLREKIEITKDTTILIY